MNIFELMAKIGVDTSKYEEGLGDAEKRADTFSSNLKKTISTAVKAVGVASVAAVGAAGAGIAKLTTEAVKAYGDYEQLVGGVEKLFGDSANIVSGYASQAYKSAGLSANQYMETVTSFSAALINNLNGDTKKAADLADVAIRDMSDNANVFGSDIQSIMAAYQGFSKQNYTLLDNLKLGYGGTKSEVERLIRDAEKLDTTFSVTHKKTKQGADEITYGYADIVKAIHIVQTEMNITGTTSREASSTIQGSIGQMQSAWQNLITGLGDSNANLKPLIDGVISSAITVVKNIQPIAQQAIQGIVQLIQEAGPILAENVPPMIESILPPLISTIVVLVNKTAEVLPGLIESLLPSIISAATSVIQAVVVVLPRLLLVLSRQLPVILQQLIPAILEVLPQIIVAAVEIVRTIGQAFADNAELIMNSLMSLIHLMVDVFLTPENIRQFVVVAVRIMLTISEAIVKNIPEILGAIVIVLANVVQALIEAFPDILDLVIGFIKNLGNDVGEKLYATFGDTLFNLITQVQNWFVNAGTIIRSGFDAIVGFFRNSGTNIKNAVSGLWTNITSFFTNGFTAIKTKVSDGLENIKSKFTSIFDNVKSTVQKAIEFIKGIFKFDWSLPKIKLPHFSVSGGEAPWGFGGKGSLPTVKVQWYAKAMDAPYILNRATIFGAMGNNLLGGGESGQELVVGTNKLMSMMRQAVGINAKPINIYIYGAEGQDVRELAKAVSKEMQYLINDQEAAYGLT